jgi:hypothetical protein
MDCFFAMRPIPDATRLWRWLFGLGVLLSLTGRSVAQPVQAPTRAVVTHSGDDQVGRSLVYEVREAVSASSQMQLVEPTSTDAAVVLSIVTLDPEERRSLEGTSTIYSATWTFFLSRGRNTVELYLTSQVGVSGMRRTGETARGLVATTDEVRRDVPGRIRQLAGFIDRMRQESRR